MDPAPNPVNPDNTDPGHLPPEPLVPTDTPSPRNHFGAWLKVNGWKLLVMLGVIGFVCWKFYWVDVLLAGLGLSGIIFLHELGHFLAAKLCNVYVRTFSIGFGPAWPFCQFKYGETNYKLGMIPLGGFVAMAGEPTGETDPDAVKDDVDDDTDPRSFKNRPVWQRMIIISAGVVMNVLLAAGCFVAAYLHGVKEMPPVVQGVEPGSAAWQAGVRPGSTVTKLNDIDRPTFADIPPEVSSTGKGKTVHLETSAGTFDIEPLVAEGGYYPTLGLTFPFGLQLEYSKRDDARPYTPGTPADPAGPLATGYLRRPGPVRPGGPAENPALPPAVSPLAGQPPILGGDTIIGMTEPASPGHTSPLHATQFGPGVQFDYRRRLSALAGSEVTLVVLRLDRQGVPKESGPELFPSDAVAVTLPPAFRQDTGLRMKMGQIAAVRAGTAAEKGAFNVQKMEGDKTLSDGDVIVRVTGGGKTFFDATDATANDPLRLPFALNQWAGGTRVPKAVSVTVQPAGGGEPRAVDLAWNDADREDAFQLGGPGTPLPLGGLGLAYRVSSEVAAVVPGSPAEQAKLQPGDVMKEVRFSAQVFKKGADGGVTTDTKAGNWDTVKPHHWAYVDYKLQVQPPHKYDFTADRAGAKVEGTIQAKADESWGVPWTGLDFRRQTEEQKAADVLDALRLGGRRTVRGIKANYQGLYGMAVGRISPFTMSGPITLATTSYKLAGEDPWTLILFLGLISVSLAVVNFLPIPVLDGGHMVFLLYEAVFRRPAAIWLQNWLTIAGLLMVGCLMLFTIGLDIYKHFFAG